MNISGCIEQLKMENLLKHSGVLSNSSPTLETEITSISFNSKEVKKGGLFICKGDHFNSEYLIEAVDAGAVVYLAEEKYELPPSKEIPGVIVNDIRKAMTSVSLWFYRNPSQEVDIAGFTATKGKTTATHMMKSAMDAWQERGPCGLISTIEMFDGKETVESFNTTPEAPELQLRLRNMADSRLGFCSLEVSSQGLRYGRTDGTRFKIGVFMNIARDHISPKEHKDFEDYFTAKLKLFDQSEIALVNLDMDYYQRTIEYAREHSSQVFTYSLENPDSDFYCHDIHKDGNYTGFSVRGNLIGDERFAISMPGRFNVSNGTAVIAACLLMGEPVDCIRRGIKDARVDGRMEIFKSDDGNVVAVVDYAHNKLSFESLFNAMEEDYPIHSRNSKIIFGCVGEKAFERREELGTIAGQRAAFSYISADYPGHEPFEKIASEIAHYIEKEGGDYTIIEDRNVAIEDAIMTADGPTLVMACAFGRLNWQKYGDEYIYRESDVECVERCLAEYNKRHQQ